MKRQILAVLLSLTLAAVLTACGSNSGTGSGDDVLGDGDTLPDAAAEDDSEAGDHKGGTKDDREDDGRGNGDGEGSDDQADGNGGADGNSLDGLGPDAAQVCDPGTFKPAGEICVKCLKDGSGWAETGGKIDDGNDCTDDTCDEKDGVNHEKTTDPCDDGDFTTIDDTCGDGKCEGTPTVDCDGGDWFVLDDVCILCNGDGDGVKGEGIPMDDGNDCTLDECDPGTAVDHEPLDSGPCDDGDPATVWDHCEEGVCVNNEPIVCPAGDWFEKGDGLCYLCNGDGDGIKGQGAPIDDNNVCTLDECDAGNGVDHYNANGMPCDDGNPATSGDTCKAGICAGS